ncbi:DUF882 domain-containing protein [Verrucomicrobiaceae bacterium N1E253]|uniref:DUF882 domain-containing protein n=1 Tax=Oceaniferula marina TaxID=2748318 RepID=A0A851GHL5_9BACT|nr:D-Ala-D-Ala carboxypeptidase family metallohydrolase [Oceaniferula marina]NWK56846.1 DUF882 domain-containing protein [Oceaniferula marina]
MPQPASKHPTDHPTDHTQTPIIPSKDTFFVNGGIPLCLRASASTSRRKFLAMAGLTAVGAMAGSTGVRAALFSTMSDKPVPGIPHAWVQAKGTDVLRYANYIQSLNLRNVTPRMVLAPHFKTRGRTSNTLPPKSQWKSIANTLKVVDKMVVKMGSPLREITSAYRSPRYNRAVGGKSRSYHMQNLALDLKFKGVSAYHAQYVAKQLRKQGVFKGGVGRYPSFTHIDTRGTNVSW